MSSNLLQQGSSGDDVKTVQRALNRILAGIQQIAPDGIYGTATIGAVKIVQTKAHIPADGIVGASTLQALDLIVATGKR